MTINTILISNAILNLYPNVEFDFPHNSERLYDDIIWRVKPDGITEEKINNEISRIEIEWIATQYQRDRAEQYSTWQEQMDMQYHDQLDGTTTWKDAIAKVKSDNPKP